MRWTYDKPKKPGFYWYSKCFIDETPFVETAPCGIIYVGWSKELCMTDEENVLLALSPVSESLVEVTHLSGMFSDEPIAMPEAA